LEAEVTWFMLIGAGAVVCAVGAILAKRLLVSALWLAGASALVALLLYLLGAPEIAVIELSVGAGLVTVLFVFAITIAGEESLEARSLMPRSLAIGLIGSALLMLGWLCFPRSLLIPSPTPAEISAILWDQRGLDMLVQVAMIFAGVLGVLGLLAERQGPDKPGEGAHS
jgi:NADH:ubiquinone oxidoreductase subunit 6 (subunit J)